MTLRKSRKNDADVTELNNAAKTLLANIRFMDVDDPIKTIVITSSIPNEGKSFVAEILSEAIATSGKSVLLMEGDLRRRTLAHRVGVHARHGLYSVLAGSTSPSDAIVITHVPYMYFLDAEPNIPNPSDLFNSHRFATFMSGLANSYDYVVIDTPPVGAFIDAAVLSHMADATLLIVRENFTKRDQIKDAYEQLQKAGGNVTGVVMNYCKHQSNEYYYSYYYNDADEDSAPSFKASTVAHPRTAQTAPRQTSKTVHQHVRSQQVSSVGTVDYTPEAKPHRNPYLNNRA
jgi:capsular exopolysaccharide synthesis family protein